MLNLNNQFNNSNEESKTSPLLNRKMVYITNHYNRNQEISNPHLTLLQTWLISKE